MYSSRSFSMLYCRKYSVKFLLTFAITTCGENYQLKKIISVRIQRTLWVSMCHIFPWFGSGTSWNTLLKNLSDKETLSHFAALRITALHSSSLPCVYNQRGDSGNILKFSMEDNLNFCISNLVFKTFFHISLMNIKVPKISINWKWPKKVKSIHGRQFVQFVFTVTNSASYNFCFVSYSRKHA